ncbi:MAG TPA: hypothetical protein PLJ21_01015 [Pseudobdellovibrionaceae bacterium]|nr:hypothetical protein [Pseudobdellovibrionaceae bacterium]
MKKMLLINFLNLFIYSLALASPNRIQSVLFDKGKPHKIFMHPGLGTVVSFPCFVSDSFIGDDTQVEVKPSPSTRKNLLINLKQIATRATNLIVRCEGQRTHFVLDLVPSRRLHQDILEIRASFGRAEIIESELSQNTPEIVKKNSQKKIIVQNPILLETSKELNK